MHLRHIMVSLGILTAVLFAAAPADAWGGRTHRKITTLKDFRNHVFHIHGSDMGNGPFKVQQLANEIVDDIKSKKSRATIVQKLGWLSFSSRGNGSDAYRTARRKFRPCAYRAYLACQSSPRSA